MCHWLYFRTDSQVNRFWRCASSVLTRRPSPRHPWPQVKWDVPRTRKDCWPPLPSSGSGGWSSSSLPLPVEAPCSSCPPCVPVVFPDHSAHIWRKVSQSRRIHRRTLSCSLYATTTTRLFPKPPIIELLICPSRLESFKITQRKPSR